MKSGARNQNKFVLCIAYCVSREEKERGVRYKGTMHRA